jgi:hypothetical protein
MKHSDITKGMIVSYNVYTGSNRDCDINQPVYARVIGVGREWVTLKNEWGYRVRKHPLDLWDAPDGKAYIKV